MSPYPPPGRLTRKWRKLRRDPVRFFADAKSPLLRKLGLWGLAGNHTVVAPPLAELRVTETNLPDLSAATVQPNEPEALGAGPKKNIMPNREISELKWEIEQLRTNIAHLEYIAAQNSDNRKIILRYHALISKLCLFPVLKIFRWESQLEKHVKVIHKSKLFDEKWYIAKYKDVQDYKIKPIIHYILFGGFEGRKPNSIFDSQTYLDDNPDVAAIGINPLVHYAEHGSVEGRSPGFGFSAAAYLATTPDAARSRLLPLAHYLKHGARGMAPPAILARPLVALDKVAITNTVVFPEPSAPVDIIVPVYNGYAQTKRLLRGLVRRTGKQHRIWLINDASPDARISPLLAGYAQRHPNIIAMENDRNLGFAKTINVGIGEAHGHVIILNTDTEVPKDWLPRLILPMEQDPTIASVTPFSNTSSLTGFPEPMAEAELPRPLGINMVDSATRMIAVDPMEMPSGVGFCMAMNKLAIADVGGFDGDAYTNGYYEETDWCQRASSSGFRHILAPNLFVYHEPCSPSFTVENREKYSARNRRIFEKRWPGYATKLTDYLRTDPAKHVRVVAQMVTLARCGKKRVVLLDHARGGGSTIYSAALCKKLTDAGDFVMRAVLKNDTAHLTCQVDNCRFSFDIGFRNIATLLSALAPTEIIYNGLHDSSAPIETVNDLVQHSRDFPTVKLTVLIHDYFSVCPSSSLLNGTGAFCGIPEINACESCFRNMDIQKYGATTITDWRRAWALLLGRATEIRCFSESSSEILASAFKNADSLKMRIKPHDAPKNLRPVTIKNLETLHIGVLGSMFHHKGSGVVRDLAEYLGKNHPEVPITIFGGWFDGSPPSNINITGPYKPKLLPEMIESMGANVFLFPSICPETCSFTLSELFEMKLPVLSFSFGAQGRRVEKYEFGEVLKLGNPAKIFEVAKRLLGSGATT